MNYEIEGALVVKYPVQEVSAKFKKQEFVIEVLNDKNPDWNDFIKFQLTQDKCGAVDDFDIGTDIKVNFAIRGRKWEKDGTVNYFSNLEAWKVQKETQVQQKPQGGGIAVADASVQAPSTQPAQVAANEEDDLPF